MENQNYQSSVQALLYVVKRKILWIAASAVAVAVLLALITKFFVSPVYSSTAKLYVYNDPNNTTYSLSSQDISAAKSLVDTYIVIIKSDSVLEQVIVRSGADISTKQLRDMLKSGSLSGTAAFYVTVSDTDKNEAYKLTQAFVDVIPAVITDVVKAGGVSVFDPPIEAESPDSPSLVRNTVLGALVGLVVSFLYFFLKELLDTTVYDEEDLSDAFGYPVIGIIPSFYSSSSGDDSYGRKGGMK